MKIINIALIISLLAVCLTGCYEDKGNYDYKDLISLELDTTGQNLSAGMTAFQLETFTLDPKVKYAGKAEDIEYVWKIYPQKPVLPEGINRYDSAMIVARTAVFNQVIYNAPGDYYLALEAMDKVSETKTYLKVKVKVVSSLSRGICVLDERDGLFDLNIIKNSRLITDLPTEKQGVVYNVFSNVNAGAKVADGKFLSQLFPRGVPGGFLLLTSAGGYKLDQSTFQIITSDYGNLFSFSMGMSFAPQAHVTITVNSAGEYLLNAGRLHAMNYMYSENVFGAEKEGNYEAAPFMVKTPSVDNPLLFFDRLNKKITPVGRWGDVNVFEGTPGTAFDVNNIDKDLVALQQGFNNNTYAIFKDKNVTKYYLYEGDFSAKIPVPKAVYDMSVCPGVDANTIFTFGSRGAYCFYASGHNVYKYDYTANAVKDAIPAFANETVTCMKIFQKSGHALDGKLLMVATVDDSSGEGKLYFLDFNEISGTVDQEGLKTPYDKFGRIKDFVNKE